jgi:hypothetical protein
MNITLGVYDLFAYAAPGSLYLALVIYVADRLSWVDPLRLLQSNTAVVIISGTILSYLLGHITYRLGYILSRAYGHDKNLDDAVREFVERVPTAKSRLFLHANRAVLQAAVELHNLGAAAEIGRLRAVGLMLRNSAPVFVLGTIIELADAVTGTHIIVAVCCIVIFPIVAIGCLYQSATMRHWANMKTFELAYWIPDIDHGLSQAGSSPKRPARPRTTSAGQSPGQSP